MKMTFQPKKKSRKRVHGFRKRMHTANAEKYYQTGEQKEDISYPHRSQLCGLFFYSKVLL